MSVFFVLPVECFIALPVEWFLLPYLLNISLIVFFCFFFLHYLYISFYNITCWLVFITLLIDLFLLHYLISVVYYITYWAFKNYINCWSFFFITLPDGCFLNYITCWMVFNNITSWMFFITLPVEWFFFVGYRFPSPSTLPVRFTVNTKYWGP